MLVKNHYTINEMQTTDGGAIYSVVLNRECPVYEGHFPGMPISPGVCNIQMLRECAEQMTGKKLRIRAIRQCRMLQLIVPSDEVLRVEVSLNEGQLSGSISRGEQVCLTLRAEVTEE